MAGYGSWNQKSAQSLGTDLSKNFGAVVAVAVAVGGECADKQVGVVQAELKRQRVLLSD